MRVVFSAKENLMWHFFGMAHTGGVKPAVLLNRLVKEFFTIFKNTG